MEPEIFIEHEVIRSGIYKLISDCFYPPDETVYRKMKTLHTKIGMYCPGEIRSLKIMGNRIPSRKDQLELEVDHARLFVGPYTLLAPPYGSVYLDAERRIMGDSTFEVVNCYREAGLIVTEDFKNPPDHIVVELEFMHFLIAKEIEATTKENALDFANALNKQQTFLDTHLCPWIFEFVDNVERNAQTSFYRNLARITKAYISYDFQTITSMANILHLIGCDSNNSEPLSIHP